MALLNFAKSQAPNLTVALATDETIMSLKKVHPAFSFEQRVEALQKTSLVNAILPSKPHDDYQCIRTAQPNVIVLGYDQSALRDHLLDWLKQHKMAIEIVTAPSHQPEMYKTSLLYDRPQITP